MQSSKKKFLIISSIAVIIIVFAFFCALFAPSVLKYLKRSPAYEARKGLLDIFTVEISYFQEVLKKNEKEKTNVPPQFVSAPATPKGMPTKDKRDGDWDHPSWKALKFKPKGPVRYVYEVKAKGTGKDASCEIVVIGDLDGDGETSLFMRQVDAERAKDFDFGLDYNGAGAYIVNEME